jgi:hypothetical protein
MISKWFKSKEKAIKMRLAGSSLKDVEDNLGIPRSTLSGWFKSVKLSYSHKKALEYRHKQALIKARKEAVKWHNAQKTKRLEIAKQQALDLINKIDFSNRVNIELALAMLYLGEGFKKNSETGIGNADPLILKFFIKTMKLVFSIEEKDMTCYLHLRADQDSIKLIKYWSKELEIPIENFRKTSFDQRTSGSKSYDSYNGVCVVRCGNLAIQRKLVYLSRIYCEKVITNLGG